MSGIFSGSKPSVDQTQTPSLYPGYNAAENQMGTAAQALIPTLGQAYPGQVNAPINPTLAGSFTDIQNWANSPSWTQSGTFQTANNLFNQVLSGADLGQQSQFNKYLGQQAISQDAPQAMAQTSAQLARTGPMSSSNAQQQLGNVGTQLGQYLTGLKAQDYDTQKNLQLQAMQAAPAWTSAIQQAPAQQAQIAQQSGLTQQNLDQSQLQNLYQQYLNQRAEQLMPITGAGDMLSAANATPSYQYQVSPGTNSTWSQYIAPALSLLGPNGMAAGQIGNMFSSNYGNSTGTMGASVGSSGGSSVGGNILQSLMGMFGYQGGNDTAGLQELNQFLNQNAAGTNIGGEAGMSMLDI